MSPEQRNERARRARDVQRVRTKLKAPSLEAQARNALRKLDNWMQREIVRQRVWDND